MSLSKQITIWCDDCVVWEQRSTTAKNARKALKALGWTCHRRDGEVVDYCPKCSEERKKP